MENTTGQETQGSHFCQCVQTIIEAEKEAVRQVRDGYRRLGLEMPQQADQNKPMTIKERLGLK